MVGSPYEKNGKVKPAFCAGGDVKKVYLAGIGKEDDKSLTADFFREEYQLNHMIATQAPHMPQVSIWDGVVMGGGVGLSVHGKYRVATERTIFAMPECKIGLFPDVGGTWWIPRLTLYNHWKSGLVGGVGSYLALTGGRLAAEDLIYAGIATHYVKSEHLDDLKIALADSTRNPSANDLTGVLMSFHDHNVDTESSFLSQNRNDIDFAFDGKDTMEEIISALDSMGEDSQFGQSTLKTFKQMSPTSLKVTLEGLKRGAKLFSVGEALQMEFRMSQAFMREDSDFYEGIRAALVDKDGKPKWSPLTLEEVTEDIVDSYFEPLGDKELDVNTIGSAKL